MSAYRFEEYPDVYINGIDIENWSETEKEILHQQAKCCQAMVDADIDTMKKLISTNKVYHHMNGREQTREEYFADIKNGSLNYYEVGMDTPQVKVKKKEAYLIYTALLDAEAYGMKAIFPIRTVHLYKKRKDGWIEVNSI